METKRDNEDDVMVVVLVSRFAILDTSFKFMVLLFGNLENFN